MPTTAARDQRLCSGAVRTLVVIRAAIGRDAGRVITKAYLARTLGFSERTVQRHISALKRLGYLTTEAVFAPNGQQIGQRIAIAGAARPFWQRGETELPPIKDFSRNGASRERETAQKPTEKLPSGCCDSVERACGPSEPAG